MAKLALTPISAGYALVATFNANNDLIEAALENTVSRDGTTPNTMSGVLDMNSQFLTNLPDPTHAQHATTKSYVDDLVVAVAGGSGDFNVALPYTLTNTWTFEGASYHENFIVQEVGGAADQLSVTLDGTDINMVATSITDWNFDSGAGSTSFVFSVNGAEFSIENGYVNLLSGNTLRVYDADGDDYVYLDHNATYCSMGALGSDAGQVSMRFNFDTLYLKETASANADVGSTGQVWVKSDSPTTLYYTDENGTDQLLDPSVSPVNNQSASYTFLIGDKGKTIRYTGGTVAQTYTIPAEASVDYPIGTMIGIENDGTVAVTLAITSDTLTWSKDNTTGSRTMAAGTSAVIKKVASTKWKVAGSALMT